MYKFFFFANKVQNGCHRGIDLINKLYNDTNMVFNRLILTFELVNNTYKRKKNISRTDNKSK